MVAAANGIKSVVDGEYRTDKGPRCVDEVPTVKEAK
jgi:hypothetical protein